MAMLTTHCGYTHYGYTSTHHGNTVLTKVSAVYSTLSRRNAKAQTDALALSADVAEQVGIARTFILTLPLPLPLPLPLTP